MPGVDKLEGEFRVPLDMGTGSHKSKFVACPSCKEVKYVKKICRYIICNNCNNGFDPLKEKTILDNIDPGKLHIRGEKELNFLHFRKKRNIQSQMFIEGKTRRSMGSTKYWGELSRRIKTQKEF